MQFMQKKIDFLNQLPLNYGIELQIPVLKGFFSLKDSQINFHWN